MVLVLMVLVLDLMVLVHEICISVCRVHCTLRMQDARPEQEIVQKGTGTQKLDAVKLRLALSPFLLLFLPSASYKVVSI